MVAIYSYLWKLPYFCCSRPPFPYWQCCNDATELICQHCDVGAGVGRVFWTFAL